MENVVDAIIAARGPNGNLLPVNEAQYETYAILNYTMSSSEGGVISELVAINPFPISSHSPPPPEQDSSPSPSSSGNQRSSAITDLMSQPRPSRAITQRPEPEQEADAGWNAQSHEQKMDEAIKRTLLIARYYDPDEKKKMEERARLKREEQAHIEQEKAARKERERGTGVCVICNDEQAIFASIRCGHLAMCQSCSRDVMREDTPKCPICREPITISRGRLVRIYMP